MTLAIEQFLERARALDAIRFDEVMAVIAEHYTYTPAAFSNGQVDNLAGQNEGSCKLLAFADLHQLDAVQTLNLFGDYYRREVLEDPAGATHANIRAFMREGWGGICFAAAPLAPKGA